MPPVTRTKDKTPDLALTSVRCATTTNLPAGAAPTTVDGVTVAVGDRLLYKDQTDAKQNGIYEKRGDGMLVRALDFDENVEVQPGLRVYVQQGTANGGKTYTLTTPATGNIDIGVTEIDFSQAVNAAFSGITALTDNSGGATADGTIGAVTAPTALTDNGGGTADGTVAAQAAPVTLTDSTGYDGTHDDTVAATAAIVTITDSSGLVGTHDDTVAAITNTDPLTDSTGGSADDTLDAVTETAGGSGVELASGDPAKINNNFKEVADQLATQNTLNGVLAQNQSDLAQKVIELVTREAVHAQNVSDVAQKVIELVTLAGTAQNNLKELTTRQGENRTAIVALTDAVKELATKVNQIQAAMTATS